MSKHQSGLHVVTVDNAVAAAEITVAEVLHEDRAVVIGVAVIVVLQIEVIVRTLNDRIADTGIGTVDITDGIGILGTQLGKVHADLLGLGFRAVCRLTNNLFPTGIFFPAINRCNEFVGDSILLFFADTLLVEVADDLYRRKRKYQQQFLRNILTILMK